MDFITVKEAMQLTGKNEKTIRNFAKKADKKHLQAKGRNYLISKQYLLEHYQEVEGVDTSNNELIEQLKDQISTLKEQLQVANNVNKEMLLNNRIERLDNMKNANVAEAIVKALDVNNE